MAETKKTRQTGKRSPLGRRLAVFFSVCFLILILFLTVLAGVGLYTYYHIDYSLDESLFEMARGQRATRFFFDDSGETQSASLPEKLENIGQESGEAQNTDGALPPGYQPCEYETLYGADGGVYCTYGEMPDSLKYAFVAIEDHRFFEHEGVDWLRTAKAVANYLFRFDGRFGASTITQQLIKNISSDDELTAARKVREICRAIHLEQNHSKEEILELYLNIVPLSEGCIGVGAGARRYFGKEVGELTLAESASLAAVTNSPARYDPIRQADNNRARRDLILREMVRYGFITDNEAADAAAAPVETTDATPTPRNVYDWYTETVISDIIGDLQEKYHLTRDTAAKMVYSGGLSVYTCMDRAVQDVITDYFSDLSHFSAADGLQYAMVVMDPYSGDLLGVAGAAGKKTANRTLNYATSACRAPGSALKPLSVYAPALEERLIHFGQVFDDVPVRFTEKNGTYTTWPGNSPAVYAGLTDIRTAVACSKNTVAVRVLEKLGVECSYTCLTEKLGLSTVVREKRTENGRTLTDLAPAPLALGQLTNGVTLRALTSAYTALAGEGVYRSARSYCLVLDGHGRPLLENTEENGKRAFRESTACIMTQLLRGVTEEGTASGLRLREMVDTAGKTGTSGDARDKWFVGYTPYLLGGIWCGYPEGNGSVSAKESAHLRVWDDVMVRLHRSRMTAEDPASFPIASDVVTRLYCRDSGMIPTDVCRLDPRGERTSVGYFERGYEPKESCACHTRVAYDEVGGGIARPDCPEENIRYVGLLQVENRNFPTQIYVSDAQYVCRPSGDTADDGESDPTEPYFVHLLAKGQFVGISYTENGWQYNAYCRASHNGADTKQEPDLIRRGAWPFFFPFFHGR